MGSPTHAAPGWARWSAFGLALAGLAVSAYLTVEHVTAGTTLACPDTGVVGCAAVLSGRQSVVLGVPVAAGDWGTSSSWPV
jgi:uncharacterized membrane protein